MKNVLFWDVIPCRSCVNQRFGGTYRFHLQGRKILERGWLQTELSLQSPAHAGSSLADFMESEGSLACSQTPDESNPYQSILLF
jgi:hypothetical protein